MADFSDDELDRYARQLVLREHGGLGQQRMKAARVALVGAGGIGCAVIPALAGAGLGHLTIIDPDRVELANLARQPLYATSQVGMGKALLAAQWVMGHNPHVETRAVAERIDPANAAAQLADHDLVIDGTDNFAARLAISDACVSLSIPLLSAAAEMYQGQVALFGQRPCYRCMVGDAFDNDDCDTCAERGILGATLAATGGLAAQLAINALIGRTMSAGTLHLYDGLGPAWRTVAIPADPTCRACGSHSSGPRDSR